MARVFTDGAESGDVLFFNAGNVTVTTTAPRSGARCYIINNAETRKNITGISEFYFRMGAKLNAHTFKMFVWRSATAAELGSIRYNSATGHIEAYTGTATLVATTAYIVTLATWFLFEVHVKIADAGGIIELKFDGTLDANSFTGDTKPGTESTVESLNWGAAVFAQDLIMDDLALNDTTGGADNSWCGDGKIQAIVPNAAGDSTQLTPSTGSNYTCVDEIPANTTDYCFASTALKDLYNMASMVALNAGESILRIYVEARVLEETAGGDNVQLGIKSNGTEDWSANIAATTAYTRMVGKDYTTDPGNGGIAWTEANVNAVQAGMKVI